MKIQGFYSSSASSLLTDLRNAYGSTRNLINELILTSDSSFAVLIEDIEVNKQKSNFTITTTDRTNYNTCESRKIRTNY